MLITGALDWIPLEFLQKYAELKSIVFKDSWEIKL